MRTKQMEKVRQLQMEEQQWQRERQGALALAERDQKDNPELKSLVQDRDSLVRKNMDFQQKQKEMQAALRKAAEKVQDFLEQFIPEDLREETK